MQEIFKEYENIYRNILKKIYPAKNSTGFPERNLSVNFSKAYEKISSIKGQEAISWFEFQFGDNNRKHVDLIIINISTKELYIVESKRFNYPEKKIAEIAEDIIRITELLEELKNDDSRINMKNINRVYGVILADVWLENDNKIEIYNSFKRKCFVHDYIINQSVPETLNETYYIQDFIGIRKTLDNYKLVSFMWEI